ncbi:MAG: hypothetical protein AAF191_12890 [Verrucomicrobiota bacterium]
MALSYLDRWPEAGACGNSDAERVGDPSGWRHSHLLGPDLLWFSLCGGNAKGGIFNPRKDGRAALITFDPMSGSPQVWRATQEWNRFARGFSESIGVEIVQGEVYVFDRSGYDVDSLILLIKSLDTCKK